VRLWLAIARVRLEGVLIAAAVLLRTMIRGTS
jgi:hypothetical protein